MPTLRKVATLLGLLSSLAWPQQLSTLAAPPASPQAAEGVRYDDVTARSGLDPFRHTAGNAAKAYLPETLGSGVALLDYDNDGWLDIYLVNALQSPEQSDKPDAPRAALYRNNHDGTFTDVTAAAGVENRRWGVGVCAGDIDNDGRQDIYVTNLGKSRLYKNNGDGTFTDIAAEARVQLEGWATGCAFGDYDRDGLLDLYVARYVKFDWHNPPPAGGAAAPKNPAAPNDPPTPKYPAAIYRPVAGQLPAMGAAYDPSQSSCRFLGATVACGPMGLPPAPDALFHNEGNGKFRDVSRESKAASVADSYGLAVGWVDVDDDGRLDIVVANDSKPNFLFRNQGDGTFEETGLLSGLAVNGDGHEQAYMGMAVGDYDRDGRADFFFTTFSGDNYTLHRNLGDLDFSDATLSAGLAAITLPFLGWGTAFVDYDNDGWLDILAVNGHIFPQADPASWGTSYRQRPLLLRNINGARFADVSGNQGPGFAEPRSSRGAAVGDLFNSGANDIVINNLDAAPTLLRNRLPANREGKENHWITLSLIGDPAAKTPKDATGTIVYCTANGIRQRAEVASGRSYLSQSDPRPHFGVGPATQIAKLEILWAGGRREVHEKLFVDQQLMITEGKPFSQVERPERP
jgi:enediyne biosynthesis protein E4